MPTDFNTQMLLVVGTLTLSGFVQSVTGFGFGLVSMALLPLLVSFPDAYIMVTVLNLVVCLVTFAANFRHYQWRRGWLLVLGSCLAVPAGFYLMMSMQTDWLIRALGALICLFSAVELIRLRTGPMHIPERAGFAAGLVSGTLGGAFNMGGPPAVAYCYAQTWSKEHTVALLQVMFGTSSIIRLFLVQSSGLLRADLLRVGLLAIVPLLAAIGLGSRLLRVLPRERLRIVVFVFLFLAGLKYLFKW